MNVSYNWLKSVAPTIEDDPARLAERLGMLGAPVDEISVRGEGLRDIVVARVEDVRPHPNADRLRLCTVNAGGESLQVVCGAPNVVAGGVYPFAPIGAKLPGGFQIRKAKIRGEYSEGMLCSASELGLGRDHSGLLALNGDWRPGSPLVESVEVEDTVLTLDITPNRPDLLSHLGVARELAPGGESDLRLPPVSEHPPEVRYSSGEDPALGVAIKIDDPAECPRYIGAIVEGIEVGPSPEWLAARLRAVGLRPINNVVDATNWVLQEMGQPLHAFDLDRLDGPEIRVRRAAEGEVLRTLDGVERKLNPGMLVIADRSRPVALAGVMGGEDSEVTTETTRILIECAVFDRKRVRATAKAVGLSTEASHRYERGIDPEQQRRAVERVVDLIVATAGGRVAQPVSDVHPAPHARAVVPVRLTRVKQVLGIDLTPERIAAVLGPIGFDATMSDDVVRVEVPGYRPDVVEEIDVIEEIARRHGYDDIPSELRGFRPGAVPADPLDMSTRIVRDVFARWGFLEARSVSFASAADTRVAILNPLSAEESHLRETLLTALIRRLDHNWAHGVRSIRLYECGSVFRTGPPERPLEEVRIGAIFTGPRRPPHWSENVEPYDVWDLKGLLDDLARHIPGAVVESADSAPREMDSAPSFVIRSADGTIVGVGGRVAKQAMDPPAWADPVWALELELGRIRPADDRTYRAIPTLPPVERDIALLVPSGVTAERVESLIRREGGEDLESVTVFDVYQGEGIAPGARSIAWRLRFRRADRTLTDAEVDERLDRLVTALREELGVQRR